MNIFQVGGAVFSFAMIILSIVAIARQRLRRSIGVLWSVFWAAAASAIIWPDITRIVANTLGIGRGTDLVMYCGLLATAFGFFFFYLQFRRLKADLTKLVRNLAIREARKPNENRVVKRNQDLLSEELNDAP